MQGKTSQDRFFERCRTADGREIDAVRVDLVCKELDRLREERKALTLKQSRVQRRPPLLRVLLAPWALRLFRALERNTAERRRVALLLGPPDDEGCEGHEDDEEEVEAPYDDEDWEHERSALLEEDYARLQDYLETPRQQDAMQVGALPRLAADGREASVVQGERELLEAARYELMERLERVATLRPRVVFGRRVRRLARTVALMDVERERLTAAMAPVRVVWAERTLREMGRRDAGVRLRGLQAELNAARDAEARDVVEWLEAAVERGRIEVAMLE